MSQQLSWLIVMQVISGAAWGAYELAFCLLFFESIAEEERTSLLTFYNLFYTAAWVSGALVGGLILSACGTSYQGYLLLFGLSSLARLLVLPLLARTELHAMQATGTSVRTTEIYFPKEAATSVR